MTDSFFSQSSDEASEQPSLLANLEPQAQPKAAQTDTNIFREAVTADFQTPPTFQEPPPLASNYEESQPSVAHTDDIAHPLVKAQSSSFYFNLSKFTYRSQNVDDWKAVTSEDHPSRALWQDLGAFQQDSYIHNTTINSSFNMIGFAVGFVLNLGLVFVLFIIGAYNSSQSSNGSLNGKCLGFSFLFAIVFTTIDITNLTLLPKVYLRFNLVIGLVISLIVCVVAILIGNYGSIGFFALCAAISFFFFLVTRIGKEFSLPIAKFSKSHLFGGCRVLIFPLVYLFVTSLFIAFFSYIAYGAFSLGWNGFIYVYLIFSFWWTISTFGYIVYMIQAHKTANAYFLRGTPEEYKISPFFHIYRTLSTNLGTAAFAGMILPWIEPFQRLALCDPVDIASVVEGRSLALSKLIYRVLCRLQALSNQICEKFDSWGICFCREGLVYSALYGISLKEGSLRWSEECANKHCHLILKESTIDDNMTFREMNSEIDCGFLMFSIGKGIKTLSGAYGFFMCFAYEFLIKSQFRGVIDSLVVCYGESPERITYLCDECGVSFRNEFPDLVKRKKDNITKRNALDQ